MILAMNERLFGVITMFLIVANHSIIAAVRIRACQNFATRARRLHIMEDMSTKNQDILSNSFPSSKIRG